MIEIVFVLSANGGPDLVRSLLADTGAGTRQSVFQLILEENDCLQRGAILIDHVAGKEAPMVLELTEQQQQAVDASPEPRLIDPRTKKAYVLLGADVYERMCALLGQTEATGQEEAWLDAVEEARNEWAQENPY